MNYNDCLEFSKSIFTLEQQDLIQRMVQKRKINQIFPRNMLVKRKLQEEIHRVSAWIGSGGSSR